jgi:hypothetical protein
MIQMVNHWASGQDHHDLGSRRSCLAHTARRFAKIAPSPHIPLQQTTTIAACTAVDPLVRRLVPSVNRVRKRMERAARSKGGENGSGRRIMDPVYIEALLVWNQRGPSEAVRQWFADRGFNVTPMRAGLLISSPRATFEAALSVNLRDVEPPVELPIPPEVRERVASFGIPRPRRIY